VDDDPDFRRATMRLLRTHGFRVDEYASVEDFLARYAPADTNCLLLDLRMPGRSGLELQSALAKRGLPPPIVFLTGHADVDTSVYAMKQGALDFLQKPVGEAQLVAALERALEVDARSKVVAADSTELERRYATLTAREREVFGVLVSGQRNKQAALALGITERTVKFHRASVLEKMQAESPIELGRMAESLRLRPPQD
jgi:FixJ family two-component response regulator